MIFTVLVCGTVICLALYIDEVIAEIMHIMIDVFQFLFVKQQYIFINASTDQIEEFCIEGIDRMLYLSGYMSMFHQLITVAALGYFTSVIQKFMVYKLKDNVQLSMG